MTRESRIRRRPHHPSAAALLRQAKCRHLVLRQTLLRSTCGCTGGTHNLHIGAVIISTPPPKNLCIRLSPTLDCSYPAPSREPRRGRRPKSGWVDGWRGIPRWDNPVGLIFLSGRGDDKKKEATLEWGQGLTKGWNSCPRPKCPRLSPTVFPCASSLFWPCDIHAYTCFDDYYSPFSLC